jgi:uncharacterized membrane protein YgcG
MAQPNPAFVYYDDSTKYEIPLVDRATATDTDGLLTAEGQQAVEQYAVDKFISDTITGLGASVCEALLYCVTNGQYRNLVKGNIDICHRYPLAAMTAAEKEEATEKGVHRFRTIMDKIHPGGEEGVFPLARFTHHFGGTTMGDLVTTHFLNNNADVVEDTAVVLPVTEGLMRHVSRVRQTNSRSKNFMTRWLIIIRMSRLEVHPAPAEGRFTANPTVGHFHLGLAFAGQRGINQAIADALGYYCQHKNDVCGIGYPTQKLCRGWREMDINPIFIPSVASGRRVVLNALQSNNDHAGNGRGGRGRGRGGRGGRRGGRGGSSAGRGSTRSSRYPIRRRS